MMRSKNMSAIKPDRHFYGLDGELVSPECWILTEQDVSLILLMQGAPDRDLSTPSDRRSERAHATEGRHTVGTK
ncbi:MAG TPA: hypothetical protein VKU00_22440 [Chthonomonadaceae bacterium]|nr:hypothetical protein [Chthonomonadaceae bacterium]